MYKYLQYKYRCTLKRIVIIPVLTAFITTGIIPPTAHAQNLPLSPKIIQPFLPLLIQGLKIDPQNPFHFEFIVDEGNIPVDPNNLKTESTKLIKYFLASLTVPENDLWVNLSPKEKDRIIPQKFGQTDMGQDLLAQDYMLKQITASFINPEKELGKKFWDKLRKKINAEIPMETFSKVWIMPDRAEVYVHDNTAFIVDTHLKVMMEEDLKSSKQSVVSSKENQNLTTDHLPLTTIIKETIIPAIEEEVNNGKDFAQLRQIYQSMILAAWYKQNLKDSLLSQVYLNQNKVGGIDAKEKDAKEKIYQQYLNSIQNGLFDFVKEDYDAQTQQVISHKYFSGGFASGALFKDKGILEETSYVDPAKLTSSPGRKHIVDVAMNVSGPEIDKAVATISLKEGDRNSIYVNATVVNGKRVGGEFIGAYPLRIQAKLLKQYNEIVITNVQINKFGTIGGQYFWIGSEEKDLTIHIKKGQIAAVYDKNGRQVYQPSPPEERNLVYVNAKIENGKRVGGEFIKAYPHKVPGDLLDKLDEVIVTHMQTNKSGNLVFADKLYWNNKNYASKDNLTAHIKKDQLLSLYDNDGNQIYPILEGGRNSIYINARIENGKRVGGQFAEALPAPTSLVFKKYQDFILENIHLDASGAFYFGGKILWSKRTLYANAGGITAHIKNGELIEAYDSNGKRIYEKAHEGSRNSIYTKAEIENGKRVGGEFIGAFPDRIPPDTLKDNINFVIENLHINAGGGLTIGGKSYSLYLTNYKNAQNILGFVKNGILEKLYDKTGNEIYSRPKEGDRNSVYINTILENGKRVGGKFYNAYPLEFTPSEVLKVSENIVVENIQLAANGAFTFAGNKYWPSMAGYENARNLKAYFKDGLLELVIDKDGKTVYTSDITLQRNVIHMGAQIINGKVEGGKILRSYRENVPRKIYKELDDFIVTNIQLNKQGGCAFGRKILWSSLKGYKNASGITVHFKDGKAIEIFDKDGNKIFIKIKTILVRPIRNKHQPLDIKILGDNKPVDNTLIRIPSKDLHMEAFEKYDELIIENLRLSKNGVLSISGKRYPLNLTEHPYARVSAYFKNGDIEKLYDEKGEVIYSKPREGDRNSLYIDAIIVNGKRVGGKFQNSLLKITPKILTSSKNIVIENIWLTSTGGFILAGKIYWASLKGYESAKNLTAYFKDGILDLLIDKDGKTLYTSNTDKHRNVVFIEGKIINGKIEGGKLVKSYLTGMTSQSLLTEFNDFIVTNVQLNNRGGLTIAGKVYWQKLDGYENADGIIIHIKNTEVLEAYDKNGKLIYEKPAEGDKNSLYIGPEIKNGKLVGGQFVSAYPKEISADILKQYPEFAIQNIHLDQRGTFYIGGQKFYKHKIDGYKNARNVLGYFKNGILEDLYDENGKPIYSKPKEGERNSVYINAIIENGQRVGGEFVTAYPKEFAPANILELNKNTVVENIHLTADGAFHFAGKQYWSDMAEYKNAKDIKAYFKNGILEIVIDKNGGVLYTSDVTQQPNAIYTGTSIIDGKIKGGEFIKSYRGSAPSEIFNKFPDFIVKNITLNNIGGFRFGGKIIWQRLKNYEHAAGIIAHFKNGNLTDAYDKDGKKLFGEAIEGDRNSVYIDAVLKNKKRFGGKFINAYPYETVPSDLLTLSDNIVVENVRLAANGAFNFAGRTYWYSLAGYKAESLTAYFLDGILQTVVDKKDKVIYTADLTQQRNAVLTGARIVGGKIEGGKFIRSYKKDVPGSILKEFNEFIVTNIRLNKQGGFQLAGKTYWHVLINYEYADGVTAQFQNGELISAYAANGNKIFGKAAPGDRNALYINAKIINGKRVGGELIGAPQVLRSEFLQKFDELIIENLELQQGGKLTIGGEKYILKDYPYVNATGYLKNGVLQKLYDSTGKEIYSKAKEGERNSVYINATIENGQRSGGEFKNAYPLWLPSDVLQSNSNIVIEKIQLSPKGGLLFGGKAYWHSLKGYENATDLAAYFRNGILDLLADKNGKIIYTADIAKQRNTIYVDAKIINGKVEGGRFIRSYTQNVSSKIFDEFDDFIAVNINLDGNGGLTFGGKIYWQSLPGHQYADGLVARFKKRELFVLYDKDGRLVYQSPEHKQEQKPAALEADKEEFNQILKTGDVDRLLHTIGLEGTIRILLVTNHFKSGNLRKILMQYIGQLPPSQKLGLTRKKNKFSFIGMRNLSLNQQKMKDNEKMITQEIIRAVYNDIVDNFRFLDELKKEGDNPLNSALLRRAYHKAYLHYLNIGKLDFQGLNEDAITLKFFQKEGIEFILQNKKVILADSPGTGKTIQAIAAVLNIHEGKGAQKTLIISPRAAKKRVWKKEIETKTTGGKKVAVVSKVSMKKPKEVKEMKNADFVVVNFEALRETPGKINPLREILMSMGFEAIIVDEAHRMRGESLQTEAIRGFDAEYKILVTGSPMVGRKVEKIFNLLNWLYPEQFPNKREFIKKYGHSKEALQELSNLIKPFMIRRLARDVLDLPEISFSNEIIPLNPEQRKIYDRIHNDFLGWINQFSYKNPPKIASFIAKWIKLKQAAIDPKLVEDNIIFENEGELTVIPFGKKQVQLNGRTYKINYEKRTNKVISLQENNKEYPLERKSVSIKSKKYAVQIIRKDVPSSKYLKIDEIVKNAVQKNEKVVIFTNYRQVVFDLVERYKEYGVNYLLGGLTEKNANEEIEEFNTFPQNHIFIATGASAGESIDLTVANHLIEVDLPWTAEEREQYIRRIHRFSQKKDCFIHNLIAEDTVDDDLMEIITEGKEMSQILLNDQEIIQNYSDELIEKTLLRYKYPKEIIDQLKKYRDEQGLEKTTISPDIKEIRIVDKTHGLMAGFKNNQLEAIIELPGKKRIRVKNMQQLLDNLDKITDNTRVVLKELFKQRFSHDIEHNLPVRKTLMWDVVQTLIPSFKHIDYHGQIEFKIEMSTLIVDLLITKGDLTLGDLQANVKDELLLQKTLKFLDGKNIFKALSLMGVLDKQYYYKGQLLEYDPPIEISYTDGHVVYADFFIINEIAPDRRKKNTVIRENVSLETSAKIYRDLNRDEEIRLAREAYKGNTLAKDALYLANLKHVFPFARYTVHGLSKNAWLGQHIKKLQSDDYNDLYQEAAEALSANIDTYYFEADSKDLKTFIQPIVGRAVKQYLYKWIKNHTDEYQILDQTLSSDSTATFIETGYFQSTPATQEEYTDERLANKPASNTKDLYAEATKILKDAGFRENEIDIFFQVIQFGNIDDIPQNYGYKTFMINDIIKEAREVLKNSAFFSELYGKNKEKDNAIISPQNSSDKAKIENKTQEIQKDLIHADPFLQRFINEGEMTFFNADVLFQMLLIAGKEMDEETYQLAKDQWQNIKNDIDSHMDEEDFFKKYHEIIDVNIGLISNLYNLIHKQKGPLPIPVIANFEYSWGEKAANRSLAHFKKEYRQIAEKMGEKPRVIWIVEDVPSLANVIAEDKNFDVMRFFEKLLLTVYQNPNVPYFDQNDIKKLSYKTYLINDFAKIFAYIHTLRTTAAENPITPLREVVPFILSAKKENGKKETPNFEIDYQAALFQGLNNYDIKIISELLGSKPIALFNGLWADYLLSESQNAFFQNDLPRYQKLYRWYLEVHARSNMIDRDAEFMVQLRKIADKYKAATGRKYVLAFARTIEHQRLNQLLYPDWDGKPVDQEQNDMLTAKIKDGRNIENETPRSYSAETIHLILHDIANVENSADYWRIDIDETTINQLAAYMGNLYKDNPGITFTSMNAFHWLLYHRDNNGHYVLNDLWDKYIISHLMQIRLKQQREMMPLFAGKITEDFSDDKNDKYIEPLLTYYTYRLTEGLSQNQRAKFLYVTLGREMNPVLPDIITKTSRPEFIRTISHPEEWIRNFTALKIWRNEDYSEKEIFRMADWMKDMFDSYFQLLPISPRMNGDTDNYDRAQLGENGNGSLQEIVDDFGSKDTKSTPADYVVNIIKAEPKTELEFNMWAQKIADDPVISLANYTLIMHDAFRRRIETIDDFLHYLKNENAKLDVTQQLQNIQELMLQSLKIPETQRTELFKIEEEASAADFINAYKNNLNAWLELFNQTSLSLKDLNTLKVSENTYDSHVHFILKELYSERTQIWRLANHFKNFTKENETVKDFAKINTEEMPEEFRVLLSKIDNLFIAHDSKSFHYITSIGVPFHYVALQAVKGNIFEKNTPSYCQSLADKLVPLKSWMVKFRKKKIVEALEQIISFADSSDADGKDFSKTLAQAAAFLEIDHIREDRPEEEYRLKPSLPNRVYLDLASGPNFDDYMGTLDPHTQYMAVDQSPYVVEYLKEIKRLLEIKNVTIIQDDVMQLKKPVDPVGTIRLKNTWAYVPELNQKIPEMISWLDEGGEFVIQTDAEIKFFLQKIGAYDLVYKFFKPLINQGWGFDYKFVDLSKPELPEFSLDKIILTKPPVGKTIIGGESSYKNYIKDYVELLEAMINGMLNHQKNPSKEQFTFLISALQKTLTENQQYFDKEEISIIVEIIDHANLNENKTEKNTVADKSVGGINFTSKALNLKTKEGSEEIHLNFDPQMIKNMQIDGFYPVILNIRPITNLPLLLGVASPEKENPLQTAFNPPISPSRGINDQPAQAVLPRNRIAALVSR